MSVERPTKTATVSQLRLDHRECGYSTGIDDRLTAGQGNLDWAGFWSIPCPDCEMRMSEKLSKDCQL